MRTMRIILIFCAFLLSTMARGGLLRVEVTGHLTQAATGTYTSYGYSALPAGTAMTGYCVYDTTSPDLDTTTAYHGKYALKEIVMQVGSFVLSTCSNTSGSPTFQVWRTDETYLAQCPAQMGIYVNSSLLYYGGQFTLLDVCNSTHGRADDAFPTSVPSDISYFKYRNQFSAGGNFINVAGVLDSMRVAPEPGTLALLAAGAAMLKGRGRRVN